MIPALGILLGVIISVGGGVASGNGAKNPTEDHREWFNADGGVNYERVPERIPVWGEGGTTLGYIPSWVVFQDPASPERIAAAQGDGPFEVYSAKQGGQVVGRYFRGGGFVDEDEFRDSGGRPPTPSVTPTTAVGAPPEHGEAHR